MAKTLVYPAQNTCCQHITVSVDEGVITRVEFDGGCAGNTQGIARLVEQMPVSQAIARLQGIDCKGRGTSCPDQLAKALKQLITTD